MPDGIIAHLDGPYPGSRHDCYLLKKSKLLEVLEKNFENSHGQNFVLYGDPAYGIQNHLIGPFKGSSLTEQQQTFNKRMSKVRECVEWEFGKIVRYWAFVDFKKNLKLNLQQVGKIYLVAAIMTNVHTTFEGSQTSSYFSLTPPSISEYLNSE